MTSPPPEVEYPVEPSEWGLPAPNLITVTPVTRDKEICQSHMIMR